MGDALQQPGKQAGRQAGRLPNKQAFSQVRRHSVGIRSTRRYSSSHSCAATGHGVELSRPAMQAGRRVIEQTDSS